MLAAKLSVGFSIIATLAALTACGGSGTPQPSITLVKAYENIQCEPARITLLSLAKELTDAGVEVRAKSCPWDANTTVAAACGGPTNMGYLMVDIPQDQKPQAQSLGYREVSAFPPLTARACP